MGIVEALTPKDTEELRPGLFIQKTSKGYRQIKPLAWKGELKIKEQLKTLLNFRTLFTIVLICFIAWSYFEDTQACREFQADPCPLLDSYNEYCGMKIMPTLGSQAFNGGEQNPGAIQSYS